MANCCASPDGRLSPRSTLITTVFSYTAPSSSTTAAGGIDNRAPTRCMAISSSPVTPEVMLSCTASQLPILGKGAVERALKQRKHKPMFMVDIAVPRDIEPEVGELDDVYLYTVDDLHEVIEENLKSRQGAAQAAEELVSAGADDFMQRLRELAAVDVLKAYRQQAERLRDEELAKAQRLLAAGGNAEDVLAQLARGLTNKLLHAPSVQLKKISADGRYEALAVAQELFALDEGPSKP